MMYIKCSRSSSSTTTSVSIVALVVVPVIALNTGCGRCCILKERFVEIHEIPTLF